MSNNTTTESTDKKVWEVSAVKQSVANFCELNNIPQQSKSFRTEKEQTRFDAYKAMQTAGIALTDEQTAEMQQIDLKPVNTEFAQKMDAYIKDFLQVVKYNCAVWQAWYERTGNIEVPKELFATPSIRKPYKKDEEK